MIFMGIKRGFAHSGGGERGAFGWTGIASVLSVGWF